MSKVDFEKSMSKNQCQWRARMGSRGNCCRRWLGGWLLCCRTYFWSEKRWEWWILWAEISRDFLFSNYLEFLRAITYFPMRPVTVLSHQRFRETSFSNHALLINHSDRQVFTWSCVRQTKLRSLPPDRSDVKPSTMAATEVRVHFIVLRTWMSVAEQMVDRSGNMMTQNVLTHFLFWGVFSGVASMGKVKQPSRRYMWRI